MKLIFEQSAAGRGTAYLPEIDVPQAAREAVMVSASRIAPVFLCGNFMVLLPLSFDSGARITREP